LKIEKFEFQFLDTNHSIQSFRQNRTVIEYNYFLILTQKRCDKFTITKDSLFRITYSPSHRISYIFINFGPHNQTNIKPDAILSTNRLQNCVVTERRSAEYDHWFICEVKSLEDYKNKEIISDSIQFSIKSEKMFQLDI
jgi:hypothetical protein